MSSPEVGGKVLALTSLCMAFALQDVQYKEARHSLFDLAERRGGGRVGDPYLRTSVLGTVSPARYEEIVDLFGGAVGGLTHTTHCPVVVR